MLPTSQRLCVFGDSSCFGDVEEIEAGEVAIFRNVSVKTVAESISRFKAVSLDCLVERLRSRIPRRINKAEMLQTWFFLWTILLAWARSIEPQSNFGAILSANVSWGVLFNFRV